MKNIDLKFRHPCRFGIGTTITDSPVADDFGLILTFIGEARIIWVEMVQGDGEIVDKVTFQVNDAALRKP